MRWTVVLGLTVAGCVWGHETLAAPAPVPRFHFVKNVGDMRGMGVHNLSVAVTASGRTYLLMQSGRIAVFDAGGRYLHSLHRDTPWPPERWSLATRDEQVFLCDARADFPFLRSARRQGTAPGRFASPRAAVVARTGNLFVADTGNNRVQVFADGTATRLISTLQLQKPPTALAVRNQRLGVVLDRSEARVYTLHGRRFTLQARGEVGPFAQALALGPNGDLFVAFNGKPDHYELKRYRLTGPALEPAGTVAPSFMDEWPNFFPAPVPLTTGPGGRIWFAARDRGTVLSLDPRTDEVTVRLTGLDDPTAVAFTGGGQLLVAVRHATVLAFDRAAATGTGATPVRAWNRLYDEALVPIWGLLAAPDGSLLLRVVEKGWRKGWPAFTVEKVGPRGKGTTFLDFGPLFARRTRFAPWEGFYALAVDGAGDILMAVHPLLSVVKVNAAGQVVWEAGPQPRGGADAVAFGQPRDLAIDSRGNIWVVDAKRNEILCLSPRGKLLTRFGRYANVDDTRGRGFDAPSGIAVTDPGRGEYLYVGDAGNQRLVKYRLEYPKAQ